MTDRNYRDAGTGEYVSEEYALMNPDTTVSEEIEQPGRHAVNDGHGELSELDQAEVDALYSEITGGDAPSFHTILEVWREVLKPAAAEAEKKVTPQWASKMVQSYPELKFADMRALQAAYYSKLLEMLDVVVDEIATDDECLGYTTPEEDVEGNSGHYKAVLLAWQRKFLGYELAWDCTDVDAAVELAAISETHKVFFGEVGLTQFLDNIKFEFTEDDAAEIAQALEDMRTQEVEGE
jgi:hypothetical protein